MSSGEVAHPQVLIAWPGPVALLQVQSLDINAGLSPGIPAGHAGVSSFGLLDLSLPHHPSNTSRLNALLHGWSVDIFSGLSPGHQRRSQHNPARRAEVGNDTLASAFVLCHSVNTPCGILSTAPAEPAHISPWTHPNWWARALYTISVSCTVRSACSCQGSNEC